MKRPTLRTGLLAAGLIAAAPGVAAAQQRPDPLDAPDPITASTLDLRARCLFLDGSAEPDQAPDPVVDVCSGWQTGRLAAELGRTDDRFIGAFLAGLAGTIWFPVYIPVPPLLKVGGALAVITVAASPGGLDPPAELADKADARGVDYRQGFDLGYRESLASRQRRAALLGGAAGALIGLLGPWILVSAFGGT